MSERIHSLISSMPDFLNEKSPCSKYIELKCKELVFLITNFYPLPQLKDFLLPDQYLYGELPILRDTKLQQGEKCGRICTSGGGYTTTTFRRLFKNLYGVPVYEWILEKKREGILEDLQHKMRITEICNRYGFDSLSHLHTSAKTLFGDTHAPYARKQPVVRKSERLTIKELFL